MECCLKNALGTEARVLTLGATLRSLTVADARGVPGDVVLGFDAPLEYLHGSDCLGATIGRYANRIANGRFSIGRDDYQLAINHPPNAEHGGVEGFHRRLWNIAGSDSADGPSVTLSLVSEDGDQGYPGELTVTVRYTLGNDDALRIDYRATTSAPTVLNLTNHTYWNLGGASRGDALAARLSIAADYYTPVDATLIPTGEYRPVAGTAFDFRTPQVVGERIRDGSDPQLKHGRGYDHNFVLRGRAGTLRPVARLSDIRSGRILEVETTEPGLQLYTGNWLSGGVPGKQGCLYRQGDGVALETQHFPDSPNHPQFPSTVLEPGRVFRSRTVFRFGRMGRRRARRR